MQSRYSLPFLFFPFFPPPPKVQVLVDDYLANVRNREKLISIYPHSIILIFILILYYLYIVVANSKPDRLKKPFDALPAHTLPHLLSIGRPPFLLTLHIRHEVPLVSRRPRPRELNRSRQHWCLASDRARGSRLRA